MAVCCDQCDCWVHNRCSALSNIIYETLKISEDNIWIYPSCGLSSFSSSLFASSDPTQTSNSFDSLSNLDANSPPACPGIPTHTSSPIQKCTSTNNFKSSAKKRGTKIKILSLKCQMYYTREIGSCR